jgi:hypothetical protein
MSSGHFHEELTMARKTSAFTPTRKLRSAAVMAELLLASRQLLPRPEGAMRCQSTASPQKFTDSRRRQALIAETAYHRASRRGFSPGHELDDWLEAEREVDSELFLGSTRLSGSTFRQSKPR